MFECGGGIGFGVGIVAVFVGGGVAFGADKVKALAFVLIADQIFFEQHKQTVGLPGQIQLGLGARVVAAKKSIEDRKSVV